MQDLSSWPTLQAGKVKGPGVDGFALAAAGFFAAIICCKAARGDSASGSKAFKSLLITFWDAETAWALVTVP